MPVCCFQLKKEENILTQQSGEDEIFQTVFSVFSLTTCRCCCVNKTLTFFEKENVLVFKIVQSGPVKRKPLGKCFK